MPAPVRSTSTDAFPYGAPAEASARFCPWCYRDGDRVCSVQAHWPVVRAHNPLYLSGVECAATRAMEAAGLGIGLMLQPGSGLAGRAEDYRWWAADNGCFSRGDAFDAGSWLSWLGSLPHVGQRRRCLFAVAPDVLGDAAATWRRSRPWLERVRSLGIPVAVVAQNGADDHGPTWDHVDEWDVLFIGGAPECRRCGWVRAGPADRRQHCGSCRSPLSEWKVSTAAELCVHEARLMGKWVHVGRVNSWRRLDLLASWHVDSVDGTYLAFAPTANGARLAHWLRRLDTQPPLS